MFVEFETENCETIRLPMTSIESIVVNGKEILNDNLTFPEEGVGIATSLVVYFNMTVMEKWNTSTGEWDRDFNESLSRLKGDDITHVFINEDGKVKLAIPLMWETDSIFNSNQFTRLQKVIEENGKFAFVHNETKIDIDYFYPEWSDEE